LSLVLLTAACASSLRWPPVKQLVVWSFFVSAILLVEVRSSWIALTVAWVVMTTLWASRSSYKLKVVGISALLISTLFVSALAIVTVISSSTEPHFIKPTPVPIVVGTIAVTKAAIESAGGPGRMPVINIPEKRKPSLKPSHLSQPPTPIAIRPPPSLFQLLITEFRSFQYGTQTSNAQTRLWMWQDAWMELSTTGLYAPITLKELQKFNVVWNVSQSTEKRLRVTISGVGLQNEPLWITLKQPNDSTPTTMDRMKRLFKFAFGIPFGKLFLPIQIVWRVNSPERYDPHNSIVAILYRTGFVGLLLFLILIVSITRLALRTLSGLNATQTPSICILIAALTGMVYILVHSLSDNVLENSFKGIWLWITISVILKVGIQYRSPASGNN